VSAVLVALVHFLPQVALLLVVVVFLGWIVKLSILGVLAILAGVLIVTLFALGLGLFFGAVNVRFRDSENIVELLLLLATWASPVLYFWTMVQSHVPDWLLRIYLLNPITQAVELFHYAFWYPITDTGADLPLPPDLAINTLWTVLISIVTIFIGQAVFRRLEGRFAQDL
jgi:ABC-2 type transport system permease protein